MDRPEIIYTEGALYPWTEQGARYLLHHNEHIHDNIKPSQETQAVRSHREWIIRRLKECIQYYEGQRNA